MKSFADEMADVWDTHIQGLEEREVKLSEPVLLHRATSNIRLMLGDIAAQLEWDTGTHEGFLFARAQIPGSGYSLEYTRDELTCVYVFRLWKFGSPWGSRPGLLIDGRLKLAAALSEERREKAGE